MKMKLFSYLAACGMLANALALSPEELNDLKQRAAKMDAAALHELITLSADADSGVSGKELVRYCTLAAGQEDIEAQIFLYKCYATGKHVTADSEMAQMWKDSVLATGNADALFKLGKAMMETDLPSAKAEGKRHCELAATKGCEEAKKWKDERDAAEKAEEERLAAEAAAAEAKREAERAAAEAERAAAIQASRDPYEGWTAEQLRKEGGRLSDEGLQEQAIKLILRAANEGDSTAQRWMGWRYIQGRGVSQDKSQAAYWFNRAAAQGDAAAAEALVTNKLQSNTSVGYSSASSDPYAGWSAERLRKEGGRLSDAGQQEQALRLIIRAANAGDSTAQRWLGFRYLNGRGVPKDKSQARYWLGRAAAQGDAAAANALMEIR